MTTQRPVYGWQVRIGDVLPSLGAPFVVQALEPNPNRPGRIAIDQSGRRMAVLDYAIHLVGETS